MKQTTRLLLILLFMGIMVITPNCSKEKAPHTGYVECEEIDIASKIAGRILEIRVKVGDSVKKGDTLAILESNEIQAKVEQARAGLEAAQAQLEMAQNGVRKEEKAMVERQFQIAKNNLEIVERTYNRILKVYKEGGVSDQEKDMAEFRYKVAQDEYSKAKSYLEMTNNGARKEQIETLKAQVRAMQEKVNEADTYLTESTIKAPQDGEIKQINSQVGEIITPGFPVISLLDATNYVIFNLRESEFKGLKNGASLKVTIPALQKETQITVYYIAPMADFSKYEATHEKGSWDVKTFEVRAKFTAPLDGLRPGMTIHIPDLF